MRTVFVLSGSFAFALTLVASAGCGSNKDRATAARTSDAASDDVAVAIDAGADVVEPGNEGGDASADATDNDVLVAPDGPEVDAGPPACPIVASNPAEAGAARSAGYSGTDAGAYDAIYGIPCQTASDCVPACVAAGGTTSSCTSGSECLSGSGLDGGLGCLPPTYWSPPSGALSQTGMTADAAQLILVAIPYEDALVLTKFGVSIPDGAAVTGIRFEIRRATIAENAVDDVVQVLQNGSPIGTNHAQSGAWPGALTYASYGGAYDTWGAAWTPTDVMSTGFGISVTPKYTGPAAGNERAYIDSVRVTIYYTTPCD